MSAATPQMVISGIPYSVVEADGGVPGRLDDVASATTITVEGPTGRHTVSGQSAGERDGEVRFYEKSGDSGGKDIRTWSVREVNGRLEATPA